MICDVYYQTAWYQISISTSITTYGQLQALLMTYLNLKIRQVRNIVYNYGIIGEELNFNHSLETFSVHYPIPVIQVNINHFPERQTLTSIAFKRWLYEQVISPPLSITHSVAIGHMYYSLLVSDPLSELMHVVDYQLSSRNTHAYAHADAHAQQTVPQTHMPTYESLYDSYVASTAARAQTPAPSAAQAWHTQYNANNPFEEPISNTHNGQSDANQHDAHANHYDQASEPLLPPSAQHASQQPSAQSSTQHTASEHAQATVVQPVITDILYYQYSPASHDTTHARSQTQAVRALQTATTTGRSRARRHGQVGMAIQAFVGSAQATGSTNLIDMLDALLPPVRVTLDTETLNTLPVSSYETLMIESHRPLAGDITHCAICQDEYTDADQVRVLLCDHFFHQRCIDRWLTETSTACPLCRRDMRGDDSTTTAQRH